MMLAPNDAHLSLFSETTKGGGSGQQAEASLHPHVVRMNPNTALVLWSTPAVIPSLFF